MKKARIKIRDKVISLQHQVSAVGEMAAHDELSCDIIDQFGEVEKELSKLKDMIAEEIEEYKQLKNIEQ